MRARAVRREVRRERAKGRYGCGASEEAVRWGGQGADLVEVEARGARSVRVEGGVQSLGVLEQDDNGDEGIQSDLA